MNENEPDQVEQQPLLTQTAASRKLQYITLSAIGVNFVLMLLCLIFGCSILSSTSLGYLFGQITDGTEYFAIAGAGLCCLVFQLIVGFFTIKKKQGKTFSVMQYVTCALSACMLLVVIVGPCVRGPDRFGPIVVPFEEGANIVWYTTYKTDSKLCVDGRLYYSNGRANETQIANSCSEKLQLKRTNFHTIHVNKEQFDFELFEKKHHFDNSEKNEVDFVVVTDVHQNSKYARLLLNDTESDFIISCGDMTSNGRRVQLFKTFQAHSAKAYAQALGNHEAFVPELDIMPREHRNRHQEINGIHFYFLFAFNDKKIDDPSESAVDDAIDWLESEIEAHLGPKFIVSHLPVFSTGKHGPFKYFSDKLTSLLDRHERAQVLAVFTGHEHSFSAFRRDQQLIFVNGLGGGSIPQVNGSSMGGRRWGKEVLKGALEETDDEKTVGYKHHLLSFVRFTKTKVKIANGAVQYEVVDLDTSETIWKFQQEFSDQRVYGPIVTPYQQGANVTWRTSQKEKTTLCVDGVLYYGNNRSLETKQHSGCDFAPDVPALKHHSLLIPHQKFSATLLGKRIEFDNSPRDKVKFIVTTDVHGMKKQAHLAIQDMDEFDFHINGGDTTYWSRDIELSQVFTDFHTKPYTQAVGNHESCADHNPVQIREDIFHQVINGFNFYFLFVFDREHVLPHYIDAVSDVNVNKSFAFLEEHLKSDKGPKFIVNHYMHYSTGEFGSNPNITNKMNDLLTRYNESQILGIFAGHDHVFSAFYDLNTYSFVSGSGGGNLDPIFDENKIGANRTWPATERHGPLADCGSRCMGYDKHLDSYQTFTRTEVEADMVKGTVTFTVRELLTWKVLKTYTKQIK